ncbi:MAG: hypothetical protein RL367_2214, partial [Pseudomonadota bacterium]
MTSSCAPNRLLCLFLGLITVSVPAWAGNKPLVEPQPAWVKATAAPATALASSSAGQNGFILNDRQIRFEGPKTIAFTEMVFRATTASALTQFGTISIPWDPDKGDLHLHRVAVIRDGKAIDMLGDGKSVTVLRREAGLERLEINGVLTGTLQIPDLRIGDGVDIAYSIDHADPSFQGHVNAAILLNYGKFKPVTNRIILQWQKGRAMQWQVNDDRVKPVITTKGAMTEIALDGPFPEPRDFPGDAPARMRRPQMISVTDFASWPMVSQIVAPLYAAQPGQTIDPVLKAEIDKIRAGSPDQRVQAAAALRLVQDKVRYLFNGMNGGNYVPTPANQTWTDRYGDCKAKTLLLLTILRDLGIAAEPALASVMVPGSALVSLPAMNVFDHVLVRATIGGKTLWLDGTDIGTDVDDLDTGYAHVSVLPIRSAGSNLEAMIANPPGKSQADMTITIDARGGIYLPALASVKFVGGRKMVELLRRGQSMASPKDMQIALDRIASTYSGSTIHGATMAFDDQAMTVTVTGKGLYRWKREAFEGATRLALPSVMDDAGFDPDRSNPAFATMPVAQSAAESTRTNVTFLLPDSARGFTLVGGPKSDLAIGGQKLGWSLSQSGQTVSLTSQTLVGPAEIRASDFPAIRTAVQQALNHLPKISLPLTYPNRKVEYRAARQSPLLPPIQAELDRMVKIEPEDSTEMLGARAQLFVDTENYGPAIADLTTMIARSATADNYLTRSRIYEKKKDMA